MKSSSPCAGGKHYEETEMVVFEEKKITMPQVVQIEAARHVSGYKLGLRFSDGHESTVDFGPFLKASAHPAIRAYLDLKKFEGFTVEEGMLHWNDFDLVFPLAELCEGRIN